MLLTRVERHIRRFRLTPTRFGREALGDPSFVFDLRDGREPRGATVVRVDGYMTRIERAAAEQEAGAC